MASTKDLMDDVDDKEKLAEIVNRTVEGLSNKK